LILDTGYSHCRRGLLFHADGKTATVAVLERPGGVIEIRTNGKADASIDMSDTGRHQIDETTMVLSGARPLLLHPQARLVANKTAETAAIDTVGPRTFGSRALGAVSRLGQWTALGWSGRRSSPASGSRRWIRDAT